MAEILHAHPSAKTITEDSVPCKIEEGLYLGSLGAAKNKSELKSLNITHILTVASSLVPVYPNDFDYKTISLSDKVHSNISQYFDECFEYIEEAKKVGGVLVHCVVGKSRSVTIVVAYLMKKHSTSFAEAFQLVKSKRLVAAPNAGFISQLQHFEKTLKGVHMEKNNAMGQARFLKEVMQQEKLLDKQDKEDKESRSKKNTTPKRNKEMIELKAIQASLSAKKSKSQGVRKNFVAAAKKPTSEGKGPPVPQPKLVINEGAKLEKNGTISPPGEGKGKKKMHMDGSSTDDHQSKAKRARGNSTLKQNSRTIEEAIKDIMAGRYRWDFAPEPSLNAPGFSKFPNPETEGSTKDGSCGPAWFPNSPRLRLGDMFGDGVAATKLFKSFSLPVEHWFLDESPVEEVIGESFECLDKFIQMFLNLLDRYSKKSCQYDSLAADLELICSQYKELKEFKASVDDQIKKYVDVNEASSMRVQEAEVELNKAKIERDEARFELTVVNAEHAVKLAKLRSAHLADLEKARENAVLACIKSQAFANLQCKIIEEFKLSEEQEEIKAAHAASRVVKAYRRARTLVLEKDPAFDVSNLYALGEPNEAEDQLLDDGEDEDGNKEEGERSSHDGEGN